MPHNYATSMCVSFLRGLLALKEMGDHVDRLLHDNPHILFRNVIRGSEQNMITLYSVDRSCSWINGKVEGLLHA